MNQGWNYHDRIDRGTAGLTVLTYYSQRYRHSSPADWQQRIQAGQVLLDGGPTTADTCLQAGQRLTYHRPPWSEPEVPLNFEVLYEDADLCVIAKPAGLPVLPGGGFLEHTLLWQLQARYQTDAPVPLHRLGRGTSGLLLLARSRAARAHLSRQLRDRTIEKRYRALVQGTDLPDRFTITHPIGRCPHAGLGYLYAVQPQGKPAHTAGQVLARYAKQSLVEVNILTGRPHQIRIHLAAIGHPLVGDPLYGAGCEVIPAALPSDLGYHLHAFKLGFQHPRGDRRQFCCPPPAGLVAPSEPN